MLRRYVNGRGVASREVSEPLQHSTLPLWIGGNEPYGEHFDGVIDELRIYARALTTAELDADRTRPIEAVAAGGPLRSGLVAAYPSDQSGWRTVVEHETDGYLLHASSAGPDRLGLFDDAVAALIVGAALWLGMSLAGSGGGWLGPRRRRSWVIAAAVALLGATVDVLLAPSGSALAVVLVALWLAASATSALEVMTFTLVAVACAVVTWTSLAHFDVSGVRLAADDGGAARAGLLGLLLLVTGVLRVPFALRSGAASPPTG